MTYYSRDEWGARPRNGGPGNLTPSRVEGVALHWPAMSRPLTNVTDVKAALRNWQRFHMVTNGWSDIGYQEAIDQAGNVYELRGLAVQSGANGDTDPNERYGALLLVLAPGERPSQQLVDAVRGRIARHRELFPNSRRIVGHQDVRPEPTACPGPLVMAGIRSGLFTPRSSTPPAEPATTRGPAIDKALRWLRRAAPASDRRRAAVDTAKRALRSLPTWRK